MKNELLLWPQKLQDGIDLAGDFYKQHSLALPTNIKKIAFFGMGGSGIAGSILKTFLDKESPIPSFVVQTPNIPKFVDRDTLAIIVSYSGNTWETVSALEGLVERFVPTVVLTTGGKCAAIAEKNNILIQLMPSSLTPRSALGNFLGFVLQLFGHMGLLETTAHLNSLKKHLDLYLPKLAEESYFDEFLSLLKGKEFFYIWGVSGDCDSAAYRAQTQFNENSKVGVVFSPFPESCHNLINSLGRQPVLLFSTSFLTAKESRSLDVTSQLLREQGVLLYKPEVLGDTWSEQLFHIILWSDFASYYLATRRGVDVAAVEVIEKLKEKLQRRVLTKGQ